MRLSLEASLRKLQTSYVDILYVHWWDYTTTISELMHGLNDLVTSGKVLYLGISDTPAWVVSKANQYARMAGLRQFVVYQGMWNAAMRDFERDIIPMCRDEGMAFAHTVSWTMGRFQTEEGFKAREQNNEGRKHIPLSNHDRVVSRTLEQITLSLESPATITDVALSYVMQKAAFVFPIIGGRKLEHIENNIRGLRVALTDEEIRKIDTASPFNSGFPYTVLSGSLFDGADAPQRGAYAPGDVWLLKSPWDDGFPCWTDASQATIGTVIGILNIKQNFRRAEYIPPYPHKGILTLIFSWR
ncbi:NADP-dependent oxidoreductase domain-containing protein [Daldinia eschscholtzii]|nr:NADP-dependent oxidoreductase domain-containing protein [Daldinia eschscholtzii]